MKKQLKKDLKKRILFYKQEKKNLLLKFIIYSLSLNKSLRTTAFKNSLQKTGNKTVIKNRCILTARGRGSLSDFKISRIAFRKLASNGLLLGIRKSSW